MATQPPPFAPPVPHRMMVDRKEASVKSMPAVTAHWPSRLNQPVTWGRKGEHGRGSEHQFALLCISTSPPRPTWIALSSAALGHCSCLPGQANQVASTCASSGGRLTGNLMAKLTQLASWPAQPWLNQRAGG